MAYSFSALGGFAIIDGFVPKTDGEDLRWRWACTTRSSAHVYGQATASAGDYMGEPGVFLEKFAGKSLTNLPKYGWLALQNSNHFAPEAERNWLLYHSRALRLAARAGQADGADVLVAFDHAFYTSAFADHFLQDAFAAGHMGFNRPASSAAAAMAFHDQKNRVGRVIRSRESKFPWTTYGDGQLSNACLGTCRAKIDEAQTASARSFLYAFVYGQVSTEHEMSILGKFPYEVKSDDRKDGGYDTTQRFSKPVLVRSAVGVSASTFVGAYDRGPIISGPMLELYDVQIGDLWKESGATGYGRLSQFFAAGLAYRDQTRVADDDGVWNNGWDMHVGGIDEPGPRALFVSGFSTPVGSFAYGAGELRAPSTIRLHR